MSEEILGLMVWGSCGPLEWSSWGAWGSGSLDFCSCSTESCLDMVGPRVLVRRMCTGRPGMSSREYGWCGGKQFRRYACGFTPAFGRSCIPPMTQRRVMDGAHECYVHGDYYA